MKFEYVRWGNPGDGDSGWLYGAWSSPPYEVVVFSSRKSSSVYKYPAHTIFVRRGTIGSTEWPVLCLPSQVTAQMVALRLVAMLNQIEEVDDEGAVDHLSVAIGRVIEQARHEFGMETVATEMKHCGSGITLKIPWYYLTGKGTNYYGKDK